MTKKYYAVRDGFVLGAFYAKGAQVPLTQEQAKYLTAPLGDDVTSVAPRQRATKSASTKTEK